MESVIDLISSEDEWKNFLAEKETNINITENDKIKLKQFVDEKRYLNFVGDKIYNFSIPTKKMINKVGKSKKRVVYSFTNDETIVLKFLANKLYKFDYLFSPNLYSFRKNYSARNAIKYLANIKNINQMYAYKLDIKNYFNSINVNLLLDILKNVLGEDELLFKFFKCLLLQNKAIFNNREINENRGAMAGVPLSAFFANIYLMDLDNYFYINKITYARYSDDIIIFCKDEYSLNKSIEYIKKFLADRFLSVNNDKEFYYSLGQKWDFLGFEYNNGLLDISQTTQQKIKGKIRRKARGIYRWKINKNISNENAMKAIIKVFNKKFYNNYYKEEINWSKWFFPIINNSVGLKIVDSYLIQNIRYISTGKYSKKNYNVRYNEIKKLGFRSLVNEYYKYKKHNMLEKQKNIINNV